MWIYLGDQNGLIAGVPSVRGLPRYIHNPLLVDGIKFDLRIYATLISIDPVQVYICREGPSISNSKIAPLFVKMAQNLDLRCVLVSAPWVLGPKHVSNPE